MKTTDSFDAERALDDLAAEWIVEREEGFVPERGELFAKWCTDDPRHAAALARVERTLVLLDTLPAFRGSLETHINRDVTHNRERAIVIRSRFGPWQKAASVAASLVIGFSAWWVVRSSAPAAQIYAADTSAPQRVALADGSVVDLNTNSQLKVRFSTGERQVTLAAGEAHFQVAHNTSRPFVVTANGVTVRAVGTAFNVRLVGGTVEVLVTEGKVVVDRASAIALFSHAAPIIPLLSAGERTLVSPDAGLVPQVEEVLPADSHARLSWQDRMTSFTDVPLHEMVARINRCNTTQLVIADPDLSDKKIGGVIALNQVDAFIRLLQQDGDITADRVGAEIILKHRR